MTATQQHLFKLLLEIDEICKRHDIEYFLDYGTILGAVRHEGFIPWDNDLDISMTEDNYDKFVKACEADLDHKTRTFSDNRRNREFPTVFGHYVDLESCRMTKKTTFWDNLCGQCIDVFCMLELPGDEREKQKAIARYFAYDEYSNRSFMHYRMKTDEVMALYRQYQERGKKIGYENMVRELESEIFGKHYEDCDTYMMSSARMGNPSPFVPKSAYDTAREVTFEGHTFHVPGDYVETMTLYYGDNFNMFPKDKRIHTEMSHTGIPCKVYVDDFMRIMDKDELLDERLKFKDICVEEGHRYTKLNREYYKLVGIQVKMMLKEMIEKEEADINTLVESGTTEAIAKLDKIFDFYLEKQLHPDVLYWRVHFDIGDDLEYAAMYTLFMARNNRRGIDKLFILRSQNGLKDTEKMCQLKNTMQRIRNIKKYMYYEDYEKAYENLQWGLENYPESKEIRLWEMRYFVQMAENDDELSKCDQLIDKLLEEYPDDDYCIKARGDVFWKKGMRGEAKQIYAALKDKTDDGMLLLDINRKEKLA